MKKNEENRWKRYIKYFGVRVSINFDIWAFGLNSKRYYDTILTAICHKPRKDGN